MQVTACLGQVTAWLMAQRAVEAGERTRAELRLAEHRLGQCPLCEAEGPVPPAPARLEALIGETLRLYRRIERLDRLRMSEPA
jgi:regulator of CtrA degradation